MVESRKVTKVQLMNNINESWAELNKTLDGLTEAQMTGPRDAEGWTVKDHITHLAAWEHSVVFFLQGKPRHEGLGVDEKLYLRGSDDDVNAVVQKQAANLTVTEARDDLRRVHEQLLDLLAPMNDEDLQKSYGYYLPGEPGDDNGRMASDVIITNTNRHFAEHLEWMRSLVRKA